VLDDAGNCHRYLIILWLSIIVSDLMGIKMKRFNKPTKCMIWLIGTYVAWTRNFTNSKWSWKLTTEESQKFLKSVSNLLTKCTWSFYLFIFYISYIRVTRTGHA
jgi:hypothetical protein